jgi:hypothetical protein
MMRAATKSDKTRRKIRSAAFLIEIKVAPGGVV